jgi:hypothetical protein
VRQAMRKRQDVLGFLVACLAGASVLAAAPCAKLADQLRSADIATQRHAASRLFLRAEHPGVVAALQGTLEQGDPWVRRYAHEAVSVVGPAASAAIPELMRELRSRTDATQERDSCCEESPEQALAATGGEGVRMALELLDDSDEQVREGALRTLELSRERPAVVAEKVRALAHRATDPLERQRAARALGLVGHPDEAVRLLRDFLRAADGIGTGLVASDLGALGSAAAPAVPQLVEILEQQARRDRNWSHASRNGEGPCPAFLSRDPQSSLLAVAFALGEIGPPARAALGKLGGWLTSADEHERYVVASAMARISLGSKGTDTLLAGLDAPEDYERYVAASYLPPAANVLGRTAIPRLLRFVREEKADESGRHFVVETLARMAPDDDGIGAFLVELLIQDDASLVRWAAAAGIGQMVVSTPTMAASVAAALDDPDAGVGFEAAQTLRRRGWVERVPVPECDAVE